MGTTGTPRRTAARTAADELQAMVRIDTRFDGVFDVVGPGRNGDLDTLTPRLAVLRRRRLSPWPAPAPA